MDLAGAFMASAQRQSQKTALYWGEREFSYVELAKSSLLFGKRLQQEFGVKPGDRVGLWLKNCPEFVPSLFGILHAGAVVVPINNFLKPREVQFILTDSEIDVLITDEELGNNYPALRAGRPTLKLCNIATIETSIQCSVSSILYPELRHQPPASSLAVIIYTSGTTGRPKGAMLSHANLLHNVESCRVVLEIVESDRIVVLLPMFHSYMLTVGIILPLLTGAAIVLVKSIHPVRNAMQESFRHQATVLPAIPQFYRSIISLPGGTSLPFRLCVSGAAPLPTQILHDFEEKFHIPLIEGYGLSEASPVVTKNPPNGTRKPGSIGLPIPNVEVSIQDDAGRQLGVNEIGELCVRGGNVMLGYWRQPGETAKALRQDWLLTGDIGYRDPDGYFYITDRKKDMLLVNGINVYPREIEEILYQFPGVKEAAVIGKPDPRRGEQPIAFVALEEGVSLDETILQQFLRERLADYKIPRKVLFLPALPRNATGKILKTALREVPLA